MTRKQFALLQGSQQKIYLCFLSDLCFLSRCSLDEDINSCFHLLLIFLFLVSIASNCSIADLHFFWSASIIAWEMEAICKSLAFSAAVSFAFPSASRTSPVFNRFCASCCCFTSYSSCFSNASLSAICFLFFFLSSISRLSVMLLFFQLLLSFSN